MSDGACHDSRVFEQVLDETNTNGDVLADSAYHSRAHERLLSEGGWGSHIHRKAHRNRTLSARSRQANRTRSKVRAAVEHIFAQHEAMGGKRIRSIGLARARIKVGIMNLVYNLRRLAWLKSNRRPIYQYAGNRASQGKNLRLERPSTIIERVPEPHRPSYPYFSAHVRPLSATP